MELTLLAIAVRHRYIRSTTIIPVSYIMQAYTFFYMNESRPILSSYKTVLKLVVKLFEKFYACTESESSLPCPQEPATGSWARWTQYTPSHPTYSISMLILSSPCPSSGPFPLGSPCVLHVPLISSSCNPVALGGLVVSALATGPKVRGFKPGRGRWILRVIKSVAPLPLERK
jgi:hypothetical protein